jgi:transcription antitermination protein NusB
MTGADRSSHRARTRARRAAVQALYQWQLSGADPTDIEAQFHSERELRNIDPTYFRELLHAIPARVEELDATIEPLLDRPIAQIDPVELAILRIGAYELRFRPDIPGPVTINEAVDLTKMFGAEKAHRFVNGILDGVAKQLRTTEGKRPTPGP